MSASDSDAKGTPNSRITYSINRKQSDSNRTFSIEPTTGLIVLSRKLSFEQARVHEIVVVARDGGEVRNRVCTQPDIKLKLLFFVSLLIILYNS